ncbi:hypothetical protein EKO29_16555 [Colwellia sp. Arc7-635]|uniref:hypothetical protein n=1 Tax=Colwellia sp. Arc7-635 TaxID=2497879 RepID=UPI000F857739|nr:hypothetical protein [Colwellia sp. Arc7-635]AZQ85454.1 hypothetical protein EKO29_16555 [Colwellia sp. Arc7-635]
MVKTDGESLVYMTNLIIIAHKYPPFSGVGANRWAHLTQYLGQMGYKLHVLTVDRGSVPIVHENVIVHKVKSEPFYKLTSIKFKNRLLTSLFSFAVNKIRSVFWFDDEAQYWGKYLVPKILEVVEQYNVKVVIATGHPFQANRWAAEAKIKSGGSFKLIQDIRDPWVHNPFKKYMFRWQFEKVKKWQEVALEVADANVFVTSALSHLITGGARKSNVIENGHNFHVVAGNINNNTVKKGIIHAGTLANGRDVVAEPFFNACNNNPDILLGHSVHFYGRVSMWLLNKYKNLFDNNIFILHQPISQKELTSKYVNSIFALQFNAKEYPYLVSTKIYEHPALGLSTFSVNCGGAVDNLIKENDIGISCIPCEVAISNSLVEMFNRNDGKSLYNFAKRSSFKSKALEYNELIMRVLKEQ